MESPKQENQDSAYSIVAEFEKQLDIIKGANNNLDSVLDESEIQKQKELLKKIKLNIFGTMINFLDIYSEQLRIIKYKISKNPELLEIAIKKGGEEKITEQIISEEIKKISNSIEIMSRVINISELKNAINDMKNKYGANISDEEIDENIEKAKYTKRIYPFPDKDLNYLRFDEYGKSYIAPVHGFKIPGFDDNKLFEIKEDQKSYDGKITHLIQASSLSVKLQFHHVKPDNYDLFLNHYFEEGTNLKGKINIKVFIGEKKIFADNQFPNDELLKINNLSESLICKLKKEDFDLNKLDKNGDAVVRFEIQGNDEIDVKKGWFLDGVRLVESFRLI